MKFKVGDLVKCIDASNSYLDYGKVYEVSGVNANCQFIKVTDYYHCRWRTSRFELVKEEIIMHKFKVGDVVKVVGNPYGNNSKWDNTKSFRDVWVQTIDKFVGKVDVISGITDEGVFLESIDTYKFPPQALEIYTEKLKIQKDKKYRTVVGNYPARVICTDKIGEQPCIVLYKHLSEEVVMSLTAHGENCYGIKTIEEVPEVDWSKVLIDTPIWIEYSGAPVHFAGFEQGIVRCFKDGRTSHTALGTFSVKSSYVLLSNPDEKT